MAEKGTEKSLEDYLAEKEAEFQKKNDKLDKKKKLSKKKFKIFGICFVVIIAGSFIADLAMKNSVYNEFKASDVSDTETMAKIADSDEAIAYPDLYDKYEAGYLGNKSMNSLNYGLLCENRYGYTEINKKGEVILHTAEGKENVLTSEQISQINISKDIIIYRGADKKLYTCKYDGSDIENIIDSKVGTVLLVGDNIYFTSYADSNNLYKYNINDKTADLVLEADIKNFTVVGDEILYLTYDNVLSAQEIGSETHRWADSNIVKFYFNGDVYVQNNDKIKKFNLNNHFPEDIAEGIDEFLGTDETNVYYTMDSKLYSQNISTGEKSELSYDFDYYKGVYSVNGKITALGGAL